MTVLIELRDGRAEYRPREAVAGVVRWRGSASRPLTLRLVWWTEGKGDRDFRVVGEERWTEAEAGAEGEGTFELALPSFPYSYAGQTLSIRWVVEAEHGADVATADLTMGPGGREVRGSGD